MIFLKVKSALDSKEVLFFSKPFSSFTGKVASYKKTSFLNYVPHAPSRLTCLTRLRVFVPKASYVPCSRVLSTRLVRLTHLNCAS